MKTKVIAVLMTLAVLTGAFAGGGSQSASSGPAPYTIEVGGSTSVAPLMENFIEEYRDAHPHIRVNMSPTGSGDGINNTGVTYQIGMSSRELTPAELGRGLRDEVIAIDGIAVIVHSDNPVADLTIEQIRGIFTGEITDWSQVGGARGSIAVNSREEGSGTRGAFEEIVGFQGRLVAGANESTSTGAIIAGIAQNPNAIGYISLGSVNDTIKALNVGGVAPTIPNVTIGAYSISRPFIVLTGANVHAESTAFVNWILSAQGQAIVASRGYIRVR